MFVITTLCADTVQFSLISSNGAIYLHMENDASEGE